MTNKQKILIVDDDENIAELISLYLSKECFDTMIVYDGEEALKAYEDRKTWAKKMIVNIAKAGYFSSDRTIAEYNNDIWHA